MDNRTNDLIKSLEEIEKLNVVVLNVNYTQNGECNMIANEGGTINNNSSEIEFLRQQVKELTKMNLELLKIINAQA